MVTEKIEFGPYLNVKNALAPAFTADGASLLFLADYTGTYQVWSVDVDGGWPDQLTFYDDRVQGIRPNDKHDAFIIGRDAGGNEQEQFFLLRGDATSGVNVTTLVDTPEYKNVFGAWRKDGRAYCFASNRRDPASFDVYTQELGQEPKLVFQGDGTFYPADWSADGRYIVINNYLTNVDGNLYLLDLHSPDNSPRHLTPHNGKALYEEVGFASDSTALYFITDQDSDFFGIAKMELASGQIEKLYNGSWDVDGLKLSPDGRQLAYLVNNDGYSRLYLRDTTSGEEQEVTDLPQGVAAELAWSPDSSKLAFSFNSPVHNYDVWLYDTSSQQLSQVTHSARGGLDARTFVAPQLVHYPSFDELSIPALLYLPDNAKNNHTTPFVVLVHGGPESQTRFGWSSIIQYFVRRGYGVFAPNVRGSSGYGKHYMSLDDIRQRMDSVADLKAGVEWLNAQGYSDPQRIAVYGGSYGGFMVLASVTTYPEMWAAGVDIVGIANLVTFLENTSSYRRHLRESEYGYLATDRDFLAEISPIHNIDRLTAPLMVIHGANDPRVPVDEAEQMVSGLRQRSHPVEYMRFEDEGHGIAKLKNKLVVYPAIADFLDKHLGITE